MKRIWMLLALGVLLAGCTPQGTVTPEPTPAEQSADPVSEDPVSEDPVSEDPVSEDPVSEDPVIPEGNEKDMQMWISATVNWNRLRTPQLIGKVLDQIKEVGLNEVIVEVKMMEGGTCYPSELMPQLITHNRADHNFDYLQVFIDECRKRDLKIGAALTVFPTWGLGESYKYKDSMFEDKYCQELLSNKGLTDIRDNPSSGIFGFLNPVYPEVRAMVMDLCEEVVSKYDIDALVLDYCRWQDYHSDFSEASRKAFEAYYGSPVENFPDCVMYFDENNGEHYGELFNPWMEWRASVIQGYVKEINERVKAIKPDVSLEYWAGSWVSFATGQNWGSQTRNWSKSNWWATENFYKTGFADYLDVFQNGAYVSVLADYLNWLATGKYRVNGACKHYASFSDAGNKVNVESFIYEGLMRCDGLMVFELCHTTTGHYWDAIKKGIERAKINGCAFIPEGE